MPTNALGQQRNTRPFLLRALLFLGAGWLSASPSHASVKGEWTDNVSRDQSFSRVLVIGISPDVSQRCSFERALASQLKSANTVAIASCDVMPRETPLTRESIEAAVAAQNADAVLATSLISQSWGAEDTKGMAVYKATDSYYDVYSRAVAVDFHTSPSITTVKGKAHVMSKLYETRGATVVYTIDTKVRNIESRAEGLAAIIPPIGERLRKDGLLR